MNGYAIGLDLGQASDPTALAALRVADSGKVDLDGNPLPKFDCVHLERFELGTPYPKIVERVVKLFAEPRLHYEMNHATLTTVMLDPPKLIPDATGVGRAVVDLFLDARPDAEITPLTITAGDEAKEDRWGQSGARGYWVPKKELVGAVQAGLQSGRLKFVPSLELAETLKKELLAFKVKVSLAGNESFEAWRERDHDDLVLAVAMAVWVGSRPVQYGSWGADPFSISSYSLYRSRAYPGCPLSGRSASRTCNRR
jgi:hypothetical protein